MMNALSSNEYVKREGYSATTLIKPPQMKALQDRYGEDEFEIYDRVWSILGTAYHNYLERYVEDEALAEHYVTGSVDGCGIHGTVDHYVNGCISDYKLTSSWKYVGKDFSEWEQQLNTYAYLFGATHKVDKLQIIATFRDWSAMQAMRSKDYPQKPIVVISIPLWTQEQQYEYISARVRLHEEAKGVKDIHLPPCGDKDRWYTGTKYAVMKRGGKRAVKLYDNLMEAEDRASSESKYYVDTRLGQHKRCEKYCSAASHCKQWEVLKDGV